MTPTAATPKIAALWFAGFTIAAVWTWYAAEAARRDDWWDRRKLGRLWLLFDRDARKIGAGYLSAVFFALVAVAYPAAAYPRTTAAAAVFTIAAAAAWKRTRGHGPRRIRQRPTRDREPADYGVYVLNIHKPGSTAISHGKFGHGNVPNRIAQHRTLAPLTVRGVIHTATKAAAYRLEQDLKAQLKAAGVWIPYQRPRQRGVEQFYATDAAFALVDGFLAEHDATVAA